MDYCICKHGVDGFPISYWCNKECWEAKGASSRFIEHYMKGLKAVGRVGDSMPHDAEDFGRCVRLLETHPEWIPRLSEMKHLSQNWGRLIKRWDHFMMLYNDLVVDYSSRKHEYFSYLLRGIMTDHGMLLTHELQNKTSGQLSFELKEYLVVGSLVLQAKNQDDEYDVYTTMVLDKFPDFFCEKFLENGKSKGWYRPCSFLPDLVDVSKDVDDIVDVAKDVVVDVAKDVVDDVAKDVVVDVSKDVDTKNELICTIRYKSQPATNTPELRSKCIAKKLHERMIEYIKQDPKTWSTTCYHYCPHYVLYADGETPETADVTSFEMFMADIYETDHSLEQYKLGTCIVSISKNHLLHPTNKDKEEDVIFNNEQWVVSGGSIKLNTYYYDGLINSGGDEEPETVTEEEITKQIAENFLLNNENTKSVEIKGIITG